MNYVELAIIYIVGFFLTLLFFKKFGKKIGFDYSGKKTYADQDDWENNTEAYTSFSVGWFVIMPILLIFGLWKLILFLTKKIIKN